MKVTAHALSGGENIAAGEATADEANLPILFNTQYRPVVRLTLNCLKGHDCKGTNRAPALRALLILRFLSGIRFPLLQAPLIPRETASS